MTTNHIGATLWVSEAAPATNDTAGFEALTWVQVKGIQTLPVLGVSHSGIDVPDLATGFTSSVKGAAAGRDSTFTYRNIDADPGQEDVEGLAVDDNGVGAVKIGYGSGTVGADGPALETGDEVIYAQGYFHSYEPNQGSDSSFRGATVSFRQNDFTVEGTEPA